MKSSITFFDHLTVRDLHDAYRLRQDIFVVEQNCVFVDADDHDPLSFHLLVRDSDSNKTDSSLVACCRIIPPGIVYSEASIGRVVVGKQYRGRHIAKGMMVQAIEFCQINGWIPLRISAQRYLEKFYSDLGFQTVSDVYLEDGIEHIEMLMGAR